MNIELHRTYTGTVRIRRGGQWRVKPECEHMEGMSVTVRAWRPIETDDGRYAGEYAMVIEPFDPSLPITWLASGDLDLDEPTGPR